MKRNQTIKNLQQKVFRENISDEVTSKVNFNFLKFEENNANKNQKKLRTKNRVIYVQGKNHTGYVIVKANFWLLHGIFYKDPLLVHLF